MDNKLLAKILVVGGFLLILASLALAYLMFAMRDGPIGMGVYLLASALLGAGIVLVVWAKKVYR